VGTAEVRDYSRKLQIDGHEGGLDFASIDERRARSPASIVRYSIPSALASSGQTARNETGVPLSYGCIHIFPIPNEGRAGRTRRK
jgi:hypothetical protein